MKRLTRPPDGSPGTPSERPGIPVGNHTVVPPTPRGVRWGDGKKENTR